MQDSSLIDQALPEQRVLSLLSSLSYRTGELKSYLHEIACGVSQLLQIDWTVITLSKDGMSRVLASSVDLGNGDHVYSLHGLLAETVVKSGRSLIVEDTIRCTEYGKAPEGYRSYLGVPLCPAHNEALGTICSFHQQPRQFSSEEVAMVELFAERAATAIDNYLLYQQQCQFNEILELEVAKRTEELRAAQAQLIEQARLAAIGEFAAMIVHEIRNPVTTMTMGLKYFKKVNTANPDQERADLALEEANRLQNLLSEILLYAKPQTLQHVELEVNQLIETLLTTLYEMPEANQRSITLVPAPTPIVIQGDRDKLKQVLINLVRNACEAIAPGETVTCRISLNADRHQAYISIHNGGDPIPLDILPKLTQPFCSTKPNGTGLGLAIVKRIIDAHGGRLTITSDATTGTTITLIIPTH